jgi:outer membrane receptor for ferrienterochelin and colicin
MKLLPKCFELWIFLILLIFMMPFSQAQNNISGKVQDIEGEPLSFANVLLLKTSDSTLIKGTMTEITGEFILDNIPPGKYTLSASMVGFESISTEQFDYDGNSKMKIPTISLNEGVALDEVVVTSKKNLYVQKIDRMVINVASSILSTGSSALEILERSPGILVDRQNSTISLIGKSGVLVMINGKQSYMPTSSLVQMLEGMSANNVETIELITTPPANFDAEGNAGFINIVLKEQTDVGLNGSYSIAAGVGNGSTTSDNINFNYRKNRLNFFGNYSFLRNSQGQRFIFERSFTDENSIPINIYTDSDRDPIRRNHNIRTGLDYQISDKTIIGLLLWGNDNKWMMDAVNQSRETENGIPSSFVELLNTERNQLQHFGSNLNIKHNFKKDGFVSFDLDYLKYTLDNPTKYTNSFFDGNNNFQREELTTSDKKTPINIVVGKTDYSNRISDKIKLDLGIKGAFSNFDNDVSVGTFQGQNFVEDSDLTDVSTLKERILAGYGSLEYTISDKTSLQLGLRYEHTESELVSEKQGKVVDRTFGELFPTAYISHKLNDTLSLNFSYSRRITRPTFNDMAPFVIFIDPTTFFAGNPAVQPAISNALKMDFNYRSVILSAQYSVEDGTISRFNSQFDEENERLIFGASNMDQTKTFSLTFGLPITFTNWWKMQNNFTYLNTKVENTVAGSLFALEQSSFNFNSTLSFTMAKNLTSEINVNYNSPSINSFLGTAILQEYYGVNIGLQKKFGEKWGTLGFKVNDLLDSIKWKIITNIPEQNLNTNNSVDFSNRTFLLTYTNSFGNSKLKSARERGTGAEEEKSRVN